MGGVLWSCLTIQYAILERPIVSVLHQPFKEQTISKQASYGTEMLIQREILPITKAIILFAIILALLPKEIILIIVLYNGQSKFFSLLFTVYFLIRWLEKEFHMESMSSYPGWLSTNMESCYPTFDVCKLKQRIKKCE